MSNWKNWKTVDVEIGDKSLSGPMYLTKGRNGDVMLDPTHFPTEDIQKIKNRTDIYEKIGRLKRIVPGLMYKVEKGLLTTDADNKTLFRTPSGKTGWKFGFTMTVSYQAVKTFRFGNLDLDEFLNVVLKYDGFSIIACNFLKEARDVFVGKLVDDGYIISTSYIDCISRVFNIELIMDIMEKIKFESTRSISIIRDNILGRKEVFDNLIAYTNAIGGCMEDYIHNETSEAAPGADVEPIIFMILDDNGTDKITEDLVKDLRKNAMSFIGYFAGALFQGLRKAEMNNEYVKKYIDVWVSYMDISREIFGDAAVRQDFQGMTHSIQMMDIDKDLLYDKVKSVEIDYKPLDVDNPFEPVFGRTMDKLYSGVGGVSERKSDYGKEFDKDGKLDSNGGVINNMYDELRVSISMLDENSKLRDDPRIKFFMDAVYSGRTKINMGDIQNINNILEKEYSREILMDTLKNQDSDLLINDDDDIETVLKNIKYKYQNSIGVYNPKFIEAIEEPVKEFREGNKIRKTADCSMFLNTGRLILKISESLVRI